MADIVQIFSNNNSIIVPQRVEVQTDRVVCQIGDTVSYSIGGGYMAQLVVKEMINLGTGITRIIFE